MRIKLLSLTLLIFISTTQIGYAQGEYQEFIQISFFMSGVSKKLVTNVEFDFKISPIPVNLSLQGFDQLRSGEYTVKPWLEQKIITSLALRYTKQVNISIADDGMEEFLRVFNHSSLEKLSGPSENKATEFIYHFGYLDDTLENMRDFLKFKPSTGFGNLVDNFTELYVPGQGNRGLYALYTVSKLRIGINGGFR